MGQVKMKADEGTKTGKKATRSGRPPRQPAAPTAITDQNDAASGPEDGPAAPDGHKNVSLNKAKDAKNDEFYTQLLDIEREINAYLEYDPDMFRDKVVLLPCDDPKWSNFTKFFALHFMDYGIKRLISTSYAADSKPAGISYQPSLFEIDDPRFDKSRTRANGKVFVLDRKDITGDGVINIDDLQWEYLAGC